jgi:hypothetical protein
VRLKATVSLRLAATFACAVLPAAVTLLAVPYGAQASPEPRHPKPKLEQTRPKVVDAFRLRGTHGFIVNVSVTNRRRLTLGATRLHGGIFNLQGAGYELLAPQAAGSDDIDARIGNLGRIDVRFIREKVRKEQPAPHCHGPRTVVEEGHYVGLVVFRGEGGYTSVQAAKAGATVTRTSALECEPFVFSGPPRSGDRVLTQARHQKQAHAEGELITAELRAKVKGRPIRFKASLLGELEPSGKLAEPLIAFFVAAHRNRGRIRETGVADAAFMRAKTFRLPEPELPNRGAILAPPWPFLGTGAFNRGPSESPSWTGDLRVELPGFGEVHLAGPRTRARYCASSDCK